MKTKFIFTLIALGAFALEPAAWAKDEGKKRDTDQSQVAKPNAGGGGGAKNAPVAKPGGGGGDHKISKPGGGEGSGTFRPSIGDGQKPNSAKPSGGGGRLPVAKPANRPEAKPQRPAGSGGGLPSLDGGGQPKLPNRPATLPGGPPGGGGGKPKPVDRPPKVPGQKPNQKPDGSGDFLDLRPDKPNRSSGKPDRPDGKPDRPDGKPDRPGGKPDRPGGKPDRPDGKPDRPDGKPDRPDGKPDRPGGKPDRPDGKPDRPGGKPDRPDGKPHRPGGNDRPDLDHRPGKPQRPPRPNRPEKWQNVQNNNVNQWNKWKQDNSVHINNFQINRTNNWNNINRHYHERGWAGRYHSDEYWGWRRDVIDFRRARCEEIWDRRQDYWDDAFDQHWWGSCWWRHRPAVVWSVNVSPWWWWRPLAWAGAGAFFGATLDPQPVFYDPGTTVIYESDTYYINGEPSGTATEARRAAIQLATPDVAEIPVPEPVAEGEPEAWLPLGVWALTQQEQGDATMFMQFSVDKNGLLAGAYKNVMTGDEQPLVGQLDKKTQRIAWHVGEATQTVYETGFANLENDVVSVFVHFGEKQTQTWLLVRLPSPEMPPGTVKLPELKKE